MILYVDNVPRSFIGSSTEMARMEQVAVKHSLFSLIDLVNQKCILSDDDCLQKDIKKALKLENFSPFRTTLHNIESFLEKSEDWEFLYIRTCEIGLRSFMENVIEKYQEKIKKSNGKIKSIRCIIESHFWHQSHNIVCAALSNDETSTNIAEILYFEVVEYYSSYCWDHVEMEINDLSPYYREQITFNELLEKLYWSCNDFV